MILQRSEEGFTVDFLHERICTQCYPPHMATHTIHIELKDEQLAALDDVATRSALDRNTIIESALAEYLAHETYFRESVQAGLRDIENGNTVPHQEVVAKLEAFIKETRAKLQ